MNHEIPRCLFLNCQVFQLTPVTCLPLTAEAKLTRTGSQLWRQNTPTRRTLATTGLLDGSAVSTCLAAALPGYPIQRRGTGGLSRVLANPLEGGPEHALRIRRGRGDDGSGIGGVRACDAHDRKRFPASLAQEGDSRAEGSIDFGPVAAPIRMFG